MLKKKIRFEHKTHAAFFQDIKKDVAYYFETNELKRHANGWFWVKAAINVMFVILCYGVLVGGMTNHPALLLLAAIGFGVGGLLLIFNVAHDAVHGTLFAKHTMLNTIIYRLCFTLVGVSGRLWAMRHLHSHHVLTNVNGSDIDIDENPFLRLSPNHARRSYQRFQHYYAPLVYWIALPHTTFYQDFLYLFKKDLANLHGITHPWYEYALFAIEKLIYFSLVLVAPLMFIDLPVWQILTGYAIMSAAVSIIFVLTLVGTHFAMETSFPSPDAEGIIADCWATHVIRTSLDWSPESRICTAIFGGANAHVAHHLFPSVCHVHYAKLTPIIRKHTHKHHVDYHHTTLWKMLRSHFCFLKLMART